MSQRVSRQFTTGRLMANAAEFRPGTRLAQLIEVLIATPNCLAARLHDRPALIAATTRSRRSIRRVGLRRFVPQPDSCTAANSVLFEHLIGEREQLVWNLKPKRLGGFQIDH